MKILSFIAIVLVSGATAGLLHGLVNLGIVEPYLDTAIGIENQEMLASVSEQDNEEFWNAYYTYRTWQKGGQVLAGVILGTAMGSLFGIVFALTRQRLPGSHNIRKAILLGAVMWLVIFFVPFLKYPANPPTVGDVDTIEQRTVLYVTFVGISAVGSVVFYQIARRVKNNQKAIAVMGYTGLMITAFVMMPAGLDDVDMLTQQQQQLIDGFRVMSVLGVTVFWVSVSLILGAFWQRFRPDASVDAVGR